MFQENHTNHLMGEGHFGQRQFRIRAFVNRLAKSIGSTNHKEQIPIDRHLLFEQTAFYRSPNTAVNCKETDCIKERTYKQYTWVEMAQPICVDFIGGKTDMLKPAKGHLVVKTIQKCQAVRFTNHIFQLTDHKGNYYAMHATENGIPDTSVVLPSGWELKKVALQEPLIISPFGGGNTCYFNIVGDHLGQGYHQYIFADIIYP